MNDNRRRSVIYGNGSNIVDVFHEKIPISFVIISTGQSNSQGYNTQYDPSNPYHSPDPRIFGFDARLNNWKIANFNDDSLGLTENMDDFELGTITKARDAGSVLSVFFFAKKLLMIYPHARVGIINYGIAAQGIHKWSIDKYIYNIHTTIIKRAMDKIGGYGWKKTINILTWNQGGGDRNNSNEYYSNQLKQVISMYKSNNWWASKSHFQASDYDYAPMIYQTQNPVLKGLNIDEDAYTYCISSKNLSLQSDNLHWTNESHEIMGERMMVGFNSNQL